MWANYYRESSTHKAVSCLGRVRGANEAEGSGSRVRLGTTFDRFFEFWIIDRYKAFDFEISESEFLLFLCNIDYLISLLF